MPLRVSYILGSKHQATQKMHVKLNTMKKKLAHGVSDPSNGLHDPLLERINWNTESVSLNQFKEDENL